MKVGWFVCYTFGFPPFEFLPHPQRLLKVMAAVDWIPRTLLRFWLMRCGWDRMIMEMVDNKMEKSILWENTNKAKEL